MNQRNPIKYFLRYEKNSFFCNICQENKINIDEREYDLSRSSVNRNRISYE